ncbi:guanine nucleotide-binding protein (G protein), subunit alpha [Oopsacas minuta]|uniref:Guanine nucleotide-binding protein (G protein), subunit alpha n=1 Tax=Oopsacas minuta TaxID=111878 RepID=A0AAV7KBZ4_9METZ|nr:guanine nucleotide-binding protein (G protein), subunit alpha [Oopsacas minuta]
MRAVLKAMDHVGIPYSDKVNQTKGDLIKSYEILPSGQIDESVMSALKAVWADDGVKECCRRSYEYQLNDSAG